MPSAPTRSSPDVVWGIYGLAEGTATRDYPDRGRFRSFLNLRPMPSASHRPDHSLLPAPIRPADIEGLRTVARDDGSPVRSFGSPRHGARLLQRSSAPRPIPNNRVI